MYSLGDLLEGDAGVGGGDLLAVDHLRLLHPLVAVGEGDGVAGALGVAELGVHLEDAVEGVGGAVAGRRRRLRPSRALRQRQLLDRLHRVRHASSAVHWTVPARLQRNDPDHVRQIQ